MLNRNVQVNSLVAFSLVCLLALSAGTTYAQDEVPPSPSFNLNIRTIFADDQKIKMVQRVPTEGAEVQQTYSVSVPYTENGQTKVKTETRTRMVKPMKDVLVPIPADSHFHDLVGNSWDTGSVLKRIPKKGLQVVMMPEAQDNVLPPELKEILNGNVFIMRVREPR